MLLKYYTTIPFFLAMSKQSEIMFISLRLRLKEVIFFGMLRVPMMTLPGQPVCLVSMLTFISFFYQQFRISES